MTRSRCPAGGSSSLSRTQATTSQSCRRPSTGAGMAGGDDGLDLWSRRRAAHFARIGTMLALHRHVERGSIRRHLFDYMVGGDEQGLRHGEAERLCRPEADDEFKLCRSHAKPPLVKKRCFYLLRARGLQQRKQSSSIVQQGAGRLDGSWDIRAVSYTHLTLPTILRV